MANLIRKMDIFRYYLLTLCYSASSGLFERGLINFDWQEPGNISYHDIAFLPLIRAHFKPVGWAQMKQKIQKPTYKITKKKSCLHVRLHCTEYFGTWKPYFWITVWCSHKPRSKHMDKIKQSKAADCSSSWQLSTWVMINNLFFYIWRNLFYHMWMLVWILK